jgi:hypothetical protein
VHAATYAAHAATYAATDSSRCRARPRSGGMGQRLRNASRRPQAGQED